MKRFLWMVAVAAIAGAIAGGPTLRLVAAAFFATMVFTAGEHLERRRHTVTVRVLAVRLRSGGAGAVRPDHPQDL